MFQEIHRVVGQRRVNMPLESIGYWHVMKIEEDGYKLLRFYPADQKNGKEIHRSGTIFSEDEMEYLDVRNGQNVVIIPLGFDGIFEMWREHDYDQWTKKASEIIDLSIFY